MERHFNIYALKYLDIYMINELNELSNTIRELKILKNPVFKSTIFFLDVY